MSTSKSQAPSVDALIDLLAQAERTTEALSAATGVDCAGLDLSRANAQWSRPLVGGALSLGMYLHGRRVATVMPVRFVAIGAWVIAECRSRALAFRASNEVHPSSGDRLFGEALLRALDELCCAFDDAKPAACDMTHSDRPWRVLESSDFPPRGPRGCDLYKVRVVLPAHHGQPEVELNGVVTSTGQPWELLESRRALIVLRRDLREEALS